MNPYEYNPQIYGQQNSAPQNMIFTVAVNQGFTNNPNNNIYPPLFNPETQYIIQSGVGHNMVLDISQADQNYGQLIIWKKHGKRNQRFKIVQQYNGKYLLVSCSGMSLLSVSNNSHHEGSTIYTHYGNGTEGQIWEFEQVKQKPEWFYIKNGHHKYLDVFEEKSKKGTKVIQWKFHGKKNQIWRIAAVN